MGAFVIHEFKKGFLLNEERIRKINNILHERLKTFSEEGNPEYKIYREDSFVYETINLDDIIGEDNAGWQKILRITVSVECSDKLSLELDFDSDGTTLRIEGMDRDNVYLLFSDLREYLENEVNTVRRYPLARRLFTAILLFIPLIIISAFAFDLYSTPRFDGNDVEKILEMEDVYEKLNFLIENHELLRDSSSNSWFVRSLIIAMFLTSLVSVMGPDAIAKPYRYLVPTNLFLFGKEFRRYEQRIALRGKIVWGVVWGVGIALLVSIVAGLVVNYLT